MKKMILLLIMTVLLTGFVHASEICTDVPGCEGQTSPRGMSGYFHTDGATICSWYEGSPTNLYFDTCRLNGNWFHYGPDDSGAVDGYVCYNCEKDGLNCNMIRDLRNGNSRITCRDCDCGDYLSGFPPPPCDPLTGNSCVDEKCCANNDSFTDYRDGETYTGSHGKYSSCVSHARKDCGLIPTANYTGIQKEAAKTKVFNPSWYVDLVITIILVLLIYLVWTGYSVRNGKQKRK